MGVQSAKDGTHRATLVALGYSQVPGIDFTGNLASVVNDVTLRITLTKMMMENLNSMLWIVETEVLYGDLDEEINVEVPVGLKEVYPNSIKENETCFLLKNGIYGLCQAARQFWKKFVQKMNKLDSEISPGDPCLLYQEDKVGTCIIIIYVNDM